MINFVKDKQDDFDLVYFTNSLGRPYIFFLYFLQYDPEKFRKTAAVSREVFGFVHVDGFGKYRFFDNVTDHQTANINKKILYVDNWGNVPKSARVLREFYLLNGTKTLVAYTK